MALGSQGCLLCMGICLVSVGSGNISRRRGTLGLIQAWVNCGKSVLSCALVGGGKKSDVKLLERTGQLSKCESGVSFMRLGSVLMIAGVSAC